jgi:thiamine pyrophosphate-dependent acetolactate synthase large subunit-like protein
MNRVEAIRQIYQQNPEAFFVLSNGLTSREAAHHLPQDQSFYLLHAMGEALSVGIGLAKAGPDRQVVVIDGDGNALMGLSSWGLMPVANLHYYVLANGCYQTTGGQRIPELPFVPDWCRVVNISTDSQPTPNPPPPEQIWQQVQTWLEQN